MGVCHELIISGYNNIGIITDDGKYNPPNHIQRCIVSTERDRSSYFSFNNYKLLKNIFLDTNPLVLVTSQIDDVFITACSLKQYLFDKIRLIAVIHNMDMRNFIYDKFDDYVDLFVGVSKDICDEMIRRGVSPNKMKHITCPFRCEETLQRSYSTNITEPIRIGYAGRLDGFEHTQKRMDLLLDVCIKLKRKNISFKLEIAGEGPAKKTMEDIVLKEHIDKEVVFVGWIDRNDIPDFWKSQDVAVSVSDFEGRSISRLEAMANGAVPVVTDTSGVREDVIDKENGIVVALEDTDAMVDGIGHLYYHRELLPIMGKKAHDTVLPKSRTDKHIEFWKRIFEKYE